MFRQGLIVLCLGLALAALGAEATARLSQHGPVTLWQALYRLNPTGLTAASDHAITGIPGVWSGALQPLLSLPLWAVFLIAAGFAWLLPRPRRRKIFKP